MCEWLSRVRLFGNPWTVAHQVPLSMGFSRQEYWTGSPFPSPGDLPNPGIEPRSPTLQADCLPGRGEEPHIPKELICSRPSWSHTAPFSTSAPHPPHPNSGSPPQTPLPAEAPARTQAKGHVSGCTILPGPGPRHMVGWRRLSSLQQDTISAQVRTLSLVLFWVTALGGPLPLPLTYPPCPGQQYRVGHLSFRIDEAQDIVQTHNVVNDIKLKQKKKTKQSLCGRRHLEKGRGKGVLDSHGPQGPWSPPHPTRSSGDKGTGPERPELSGFPRPQGPG